MTAQIFAIHINKSYSTLEVYNNNVLLQNYYMAQPLQTASSATDEQLISSTVIQEIRLHQGETEREKKEPQKLKNKEKKIHTIHHCHTHGHGWNMGQGCRHVDCAPKARDSIRMGYGMEMKGYRLYDVV